MINLRDTRGEVQGKIAGLIAKYDFLYDSLVNDPDFYFSSVRDFRNNESVVRDGRPFELPRAQYFPKENGEFEIGDQTGNLVARLFVDGSELSCKIESLFQRNFLGNLIRKKLDGLNGGDSMYKVSLQKTKAGIYVLDFDVGPPVADKSEAGYLAWRFPKLAPALVTA